VERSFGDLRLGKLAFENARIVSTRPTGRCGAGAASIGRIGSLEQLSQNGADLRHFLALF
jgi:hypothetical protein